MTIEELARETVNEMIRMGLEEVSAWNIYSKIYKPIIKLHAEKGACEFDDEIVSDYTSYFEKKLLQKEISFNTYRNFMRGIERLTEMGKTGKLVWKGPKFTSKFKLYKWYLILLKYTNGLSLLLVPYLPNL